MLDTGKYSLVHWNVTAQKTNLKYKNHAINGSLSSRSRHPGERGTFQEDLVLRSNEIIHYRGTGAVNWHCVTSRKRNEKYIARYSDVLKGGVTSVMCECVSVCVNA